MGGTYRVYCDFVRGLERNEGDEIREGIIINGCFELNIYKWMNAGLENYN